MKKRKKTKTNWKSIKRTIPYFKANKKTVLIYIAVTVFSSILSAIIPAISGILIENINAEIHTKVILILIILLIVNVIFNFARYITNMSYTKFNNAITTSLKKDVSASVLNLKIKDINDNSSGIFINRVESDPERIVNCFASIRFNITEGIANFGVILYIFSLSWIIGLLALIMQICIYLIERYSMTIYNKNNESLQKKYDKQTGIVTETIKGSRDIKALGLKKTFIEKIESKLSKVKEKNYEMNKIDNKYILYRDLSISIFLCVIMILGITLVKFDKLTVANLLVIYMYQDKLFSYVLYLAWSQRSLLDFSLASKRMFELIDHTKYKEEKFGNTNINKMTGLIEFKKVTFGYEKDKKVIKNLNMVVSPKDTIGIVGKSGSGKSTIFNLLTKAFQKNSGQILFDGVDIDDLNEASIRKNISIVSQNPYIFNMTIKENLLISEPNATKEQLDNILKATELYDFVYSLPKKYNTMLGEGGINLSGGQRQRLAIARALLKRTEIILFDEATSALDNETQRSIQEAINNISKDYTILIIAHRLSTIKDCNKIFVLDDGKIIDVGTHKELLSKCEVYKELYKSEQKTI